MLIARACADGEMELASMASAFLVAGDTFTYLTHGLSPMLSFSLWLNISPSTCHIFVRCRHDFLVSCCLV